MCEEVLDLDLNKAGSRSWIKVRTRIRILTFSQLLWGLLCLLALNTRLLRPLSLRWPCPHLLAVGVKSLQDINGVVDKQSQPGQAKEDPRGHEDTVPLWVHLLRVAVCTQHIGGRSD